MKKLLVMLSVLLFSGAAVAAETTKDEQLAGCPAQVETVPTNSNAVSVDRSKISHDCWVALNGDQTGGGPDDDK